MCLLDLNDKRTSVLKTNTCFVSALTFISRHFNDNKTQERHTAKEKIRPYKDAAASTWLSRTFWLLDFLWFVVHCDIRCFWTSRWSGIIWHRLDFGHPATTIMRRWMFSIKTLTAIWKKGWNKKKYFCERCQSNSHLSLIPFWSVISVNKHCHCSQLQDPANIYGA